MEKQGNGPSALFDSSNTLVYIYTIRKNLIIVGLVAAVISAIASYFIEPKFKSTVIMVPTMTPSLSTTIFTKEGNTDILRFGDEKEAEQLIQILNSDTIRNFICVRYNLIKHYKISTRDPYKKLYLKLEFEDRIWFSRTPSSAVEIDVMDCSRDTAALIANDIAAMADSTREKLQKDRALKYYGIVESEYLSKKKLVEKLQDSLLFYTTQGIFDYEKQSAVIYKQYAKSISSNNQSGIQLLDTKLKLIGQKGWQYIALRDYILHEREELFNLKSKCDHAKVDTQYYLSSKYLINPGVVAEKKTYPIRWLIVLVSTLSSLILTVVVFLAKDRYAKFKTLI